MNSVALIGHLGGDPDVSGLPSGTRVAHFKIAVNEVYGSGSEKTEKTHWFSVKAFGKLAEVVEKHLSKGSKVGIHGKLSYEEWDTDKGKRSAVKIIADMIDFLTLKTASTVSDSVGEEEEPF